MKKYTLVDFQKQYPNDDACLDKLYKLRFTGLICPKCDSTKEFNRVKGRRSYQCPCCGFQLYPTKGTIFEKTTTPLTYWFYAIFLQTTTRNGVAAKELERQLDVCYKTALRMAHQIKLLMANKAAVPLAGIVEIDETYIGARVKNKTYGINSKKDQIKAGTYVVKKKTPVLGMLEREGGVIATVITDATATAVNNIITDTVKPGSTIVTDKKSSFMKLKEKYDHKTVNHTVGKFSKDGFHTNTLEGFWSMLKRTIKGTHIHVSNKHLQKYIDEVAFRYRYRDQQDKMFEIILARVAA